jgi:hypothetical protein
MDDKDVMVVEYMVEIARTLKECGADEWAWTFDRLKFNFIADPVNGSAQIRSLYGGALTFNDLVLHRDGVPLQAENDSLDRLRQALYQLVTFKVS